MTFSFADTATVAQLCTLFNAAFADYVIPMVLTEPVLQMKLLRDGTKPELSPVAMDKNEPVGFILNSLSSWQGKRTAYNGGTGVVPSARGQALTEQMYQFCVPLLRQYGAEQCLLEVIQENTRALKVYKRLGFDIVRTFRCFKQTKPEVQWHTHKAEDIVLKRVASPNWELYQTFWDMEPSWQHHTAAVDRSASYVQIIEAQTQGKCIGYGVVYSMTGAIAQLAVAPDWRNKGIGQALMQELMASVETPAVTVVNIDANRGESLLQFLENRNVAETKGQFEMVREV
ncbi:GNAT family N-acetyltransferase [Rufibacter roseus]|uniref:GNAT family N-acetyltransferase n=1 Tax=Rufibacter roseus TaxID=1567108 RepID=A0ABW2DPT0_9BACT|nr:GNAT family N-acetyltransferase [Rufibacter roseus]